MTSIKICNKSNSAHLNTIELIKAGPSSRLSQSFKELTHGLVVQTIRAVEHHTLEKHSSFNVNIKKKTPNKMQISVLLYLFSQGFCQIFCGLSLASSCRTLRSSPQVQLQSPH